MPTFIIVALYFTTDSFDSIEYDQSGDSFAPVTTKVSYPTGALQSHEVGGLYARYIGKRGVISDTLKINYHQNLKDLWNYKVKNSENSVVRRARSLLLREYRQKDPQRISLDEYMQIATEISNNLHNNLDWGKVGKLRLYNHSRDAVNQRKLRLLREISAAIEGKSLVAYALTELMPTTNGSLNRDFLDFLLRTAGRRFVESIPAIHDTKTSFGPYQFTDHALYDVGSNERGASVINKALPEDKQIPGSVIRLRGNDHFRAAWLNAVNNLALFIRFLSSEQMTVLETRWSSNMSAIVQLIAAAHHGPSGARDDGELWLDNGARQPFYISAAGRFIEYAKKTKANYESLP